MITLKQKEGVITVPELPVGTRFKIDGWVDQNDFPEGEPDVEFEVMESFPDETGCVPCDSDSHQCAFQCICGWHIDCVCGAADRKDGKNVKYVEFINGKEYHF